MGYTNGFSIGVFSTQKTCYECGEFPPITWSVIALAPDKVSENRWYCALCIVSWMEERDVVVIAREPDRLVWGSPEPHAFSSDTTGGPP